MVQTDDVIDFFWNSFAEEHEAKHAMAQAAQTIERAANFVMQAGNHPEWWGQMAAGTFRMEQMGDFRDEPEGEIARVLNIGAAFDGVWDVKEYDDPNVWIPTNGWCAFKCYNKVLKELGESAIDHMKTPQFGNSPHKIKELLRELDEETQTKMPRMLKWRDGKWMRAGNSARKIKQADGTIKTTPCLIGTNSEYHILLVHVGGGNYHACLLKPAGHELRGKIRTYQKITHDWMHKKCEELKFMNKELDTLVTKIKLVKAKPYVSTYFAWDIETSSRLQTTSEIVDRLRKTGAGKEMIHRACKSKENMTEVLQQINAMKRSVMMVEGASLQRVDIAPTLEATATYGPMKRYVGKEAITEMLNELKIMAADTEHPNRVILMAHNGGGFDAVFAKACKNLWFVKQEKGAKIKNLEAVYMDDELTKKELEGEEKRTFEKNRVRIFFRDSLAFTQNSLKESAKSLGVKEKMDFDIVGKSHQWFLDNEAWKPYMDQDVNTLAEIIAALEKHMRVFGESIGNNYGIPGVAWRVMMKSCIHLENQYIPKTAVMNRFYRQGCKGGRVFQWAMKIPKRMSDGLICLDGNSLYPSAMYMGQFPVGMPILFSGADLLGCMNDRIQRQQVFVAEVTMDAGNLRRPFMPCKHEEGYLEYRAGVFTDVYYSPDITEMLRMGYKVVAVHRGVYWAQSERIFEKLIKDMFEQRRTFQKEGNEFEYTLKIMLNSLYGKTLEHIGSNTRFSQGAPKRSTKGRLSLVQELNNGQTESNIKLNFAPTRKPLFIGGFILAYSRMIMNALIDAVEPRNVCYGDTDSVYVSKKVLDERKEELAPIMHNELMGFKNDYGQGTVIDKAYFLDLKRYHLHFSQPVKGKSFKAKFTGLNFKQKDLLANFIEGDEKEAEGIERLYRELNQCALDNRNGKLCCGRLPGEFPDFDDAKSKTGAGHPKCVIRKTLIQDKWGRGIDDVYIDKKEMSYTINPDKRAQWKGSAFYPLGYDFTIPEKPYAPTSLAPLAALSERTSLHWKMTKDAQMKSSLPMVGKQNISITPKALRDDPLVLTKDFTTSFVKGVDGEIYHVSGPEDEREYSKVSGFGISVPCENPPEIAGWLLTIAAPAQGIAITDEQRKYMVNVVLDRLATQRA